MIMKSLAKARIELLEPEAKAGDGDALIQLGIHYYWGKGVESGFPDRSFDVEFWQEQGDEAIFAAAWEMVELAEESQTWQKTHISENCYNS
jgi:hypothetical protein